MDDWLKEYDVEIDKQQMIQLKQLAHQRLYKREDKFETSTMHFIIQIIGRELRLFTILALLITITMSVCIKYTNHPYLILALHSAILGAGVLLEIFRMFRYRMNEIQFPTKLGMGRLFLYKMLALSMLEFCLILSLMLWIHMLYYVDGYLLIAYGVLPNLLACACLLGISQLFHSLLSMLIAFSMTMLGIAMLLRTLISNVSISTAHTMICILTSLAVVLFLSMIKRIYTLMKEAGGQLSWN